MTEDLRAREEKEERTRTIQSLVICDRQYENLKTNRLYVEYYESLKETYKQLFEKSWIRKRGEKR